MKRALMLICLWLNLNTGYSQGVIQPQGFFKLSTESAPTRIGSIDGPLAGFGIWGQMLTGRTLSELAPIASPVQHVTNGLLGGPFSRSVSIPGSEPGQFWYFQFLAWDGGLWGTDLAAVPSEAIGGTDVVLLGLATPTAPPGWPPFTHPAIVPIPEPVVGWLAAVGFGAIFVGRRFRRNRR